MIASRYWLIFGRPLYVVIACCILSGFEVAILYISTRFAHEHLDFGKLSIVFYLILPIVLFLSLPLLSVFTRSRAIGKGFLFYALAILVWSSLRPALMSAFPHYSVLTSSTERVCAEAAESYAFSARVACLSQVSISMLLINAIWWALPVALFEFVLRHYERRGSRAGAADEQE